MGKTGQGGGMGAGRLLEGRNLTMMLYIGSYPLWQQSPHFGLNWVVKNIKKTQFLYSIIFGFLSPIAHFFNLCPAILSVGNVL